MSSAQWPADLLTLLFFYCYLERTTTYRRSKSPEERAAQTALKIVLTVAFREVLVDCHLCDLGLLGPNLRSAIIERIIILPRKDLIV